MLILLLYVLCEFVCVGGFVVVLLLCLAPVARTPAWVASPQEQGHVEFPASTLAAALAGDPEAAEGARVVSASSLGAGDTQTPPVWKQYKRKHKQIQTARIPAQIQHFLRILTLLYLGART